MWAIANRAIYRALVGERGWGAEEYEQWLARVLSCALLAGTPG